MTADHLGSPRIITDDDKDVVSRHDYLAFGDEVTETVGNVAGRTSQQGYGSQDDIRKQYTGYERDKESGLDFAQARYYNSKQGRFTSVDPMTASANVKDPQTFNRYSYALNSPYKFTDPLGLVSQSTVACGQGCPNSGDLGAGFPSVDPDWTPSSRQSEEKPAASSESNIELVNTTETTYTYMDSIEGGTEGGIEGVTSYEKVTISWKVKAGVLKLDGEITDIKVFEVIGPAEAKIVDKNTDIENKERSSELTNALKEQGDNTTNCHGLTFTGGDYWVDNSQVEKLATTLGYEKKSKSKVGDVGIYSTKGGLRSARHSFTVSSQNSNGVRGDSKNGIQKVLSNVPVNSGMWYKHDSQQLNYYRRKTK